MGPSKNNLIKLSMLEDNPLRCLESANFHKPRGLRGGFFCFILVSLVYMSGARYSTYVWRWGVRAAVSIDAGYAHLFSAPDRLPNFYHSLTPRDKGLLGQGDLKRWPLLELLFLFNS